MKNDCDKGCLMCDYGIIVSDNPDDLAGGKWVLIFDEWAHKHKYRFCSIDCLKEWLKNKGDEWEPQ